MANTEVSTTGHVAWYAGPSTAIPASAWVQGPTLAQLSALKNLSGGIKIDGTDWNIEASEQVEDRSFADRAGAQSRGPVNAAGGVEVYTPNAADSGVIKEAYETFQEPRTKLVLGQRFVKPQGGALAAGDEISLFSVETDARQHNRNDATRTLGVGLVFKSDALINYIVPATVATAPTLTVDPGVDSQNPVDLEALEEGDLAFLKVTYQGRNITAGATYISSDEDVFFVTPGGVLVAVGDGTATLTVSYPGAAAFTPVDVIVGA